MTLILNAVLLLVVAVAAIYDLRFRRIPNWLSLSGIILGFGCNTLFLGVAGLKAAALGFLCAAAVYLPLYLIRGMGAGDVKLMAAVGAIAGPEGWLQIFIATALIGGVAALFTIARKQLVRKTLGNVGLIATEVLQFRSPAQADPRLDFRHREAVRLPHGAAIAGGAFVFLILRGIH